MSVRWTVKAVNEQRAKIAQPPIEKPKKPSKSKSVPKERLFDSRRYGLENIFVAEIGRHAPSLQTYVREHRFDDKRKWMFDFAWLEHKMYVEIEGLRFDGKSRHTTNSGYTEDAVKYNRAAELGWRGLRFTGGMLKSDPLGCIEQLRAMLEGEKDG